MWWLWVTSTMRPPLMPSLPPLMPSLPSLGRQRKETEKIKGKHLNVKARVSLCRSWREKHLPMKSCGERLHAPVGHLWWGAGLNSSSVLSISPTRLSVLSSSHVSALPFFFLFIFFPFFCWKTACARAPPPPPLAMAALLMGFGLVSFISISLFVSLASRLTSDDQTHASEKGKKRFRVAPAASRRVLACCRMVKASCCRTTICPTLYSSHTLTGQMVSIYDSVEVWLPLLC